jgi:hypothetical protein
MPEIAESSFSEDKHAKRPLRLAASHAAHQPVTHAADQRAGSAVSTHLSAAELTAQQRNRVLAAPDVTLTDTFYTLLMGLAGAGSLGGSQQMYRLYDEHSRPISPSGAGVLEALAFEYVHSKG